MFFSFEGGIFKGFLIKIPGRGADEQMIELASFEKPNP